MHALQYTYDAATAVHRFPTRAITLPPTPGSPSATAVTGSFREQTALAADDTDPQNPIARRIRNPRRMLFTLTR